LRPNEGKLVEMHCLHFQFFIVPCALLGRKKGILFCSTMKSGKGTIENESALAT
jgi:hypothetical protein